MMVEAIEVAFYNGEILCGFATREECKDFINEHRSEIDPFDVTIKTQYISDYKSTKYTGYLDR